MTARPAPSLGRTMMQNLARPFGCPQGTEHALVPGGRIALPAFWYVVAKLMFSGRLNPHLAPVPLAGRRSGLKIGASASHLSHQSQQHLFSLAILSPRGTPVPG